MTEVVEETVTEVEEEDITMIEEVTAETMTDKEGSVDMVSQVAAPGVAAMVARTGAQPPGSSLHQDHLQQDQCQLHPEPQLLLHQTSNAVNIFTTRQTATEYHGIIVSILHFHLFSILFLKEKSCSLLIYIFL